MTKHDVLGNLVKCTQCGWEIETTIDKSLKYCSTCRTARCFYCDDEIVEVCPVCYPDPDSPIQEIPKDYLSRIDELERELASTKKANSVLKTSIQFKEDIITGLRNNLHHRNEELEAWKTLHANPKVIENMDIQYEGLKLTETEETG